MAIICGFEEGGEEEGQGSRIQIKGEAQTLTLLFADCSDFACLDMGGSACKMRCALLCASAQLLAHCEGVPLFAHLLCPCAVGAVLVWPRQALSIHSQ
jgi:hypothetical protein